MDGAMNKKILLIAVLLISFIFPSEAKDRDTFQLRYEVAGVLISRPTRIKEKIEKIISLNKITTVNTYLRWLKGAVYYKSDNDLDVWKFPEETLRLGYGDCEDLSFLNAAFLNRLGYETKVLAILGPKSHAVCAFKMNDYYYFIDNKALKPVRAGSIEELAGYFFKNYKCFLVAEMNFEKNDYKALFRKVNENAILPASPAAP